jgi:hypothetical protein
MFVELAIARTDDARDRRGDQGPVLPERGRYREGRHTDRDLHRARETVMIAASCRREVHSVRNPRYRVKEPA